MEAVKSRMYLEQNMTNKDFRNGLSLTEKKDLDKTYKQATLMLSMQKVSGGLASEEMFKFYNLQILFMRKIWKKYG